MIVNVEFLDREALNNVITGIYYRVDKVIFFGYRDVIDEMRPYTEKFLKDFCGVCETVFYEVSQYDPQEVMDTMRGVIEAELAESHELYFDVTGGESMVLTVFGMLAAQYSLPVHWYDIPENRLIGFGETTTDLPEKPAEAQKCRPGIEGFIEMRGGTINHSLQKSYKYLSDPETEADIRAIWDIVEKNWSVWNQFSDFLKSNMAPDENLQVNKRTVTLMSALADGPESFRSIGRLNRIVDDLAKAGVLLDVEHTGIHYRFRFKNRTIKDCLWESGSMLELHVYQKEKKHSDECRVGVHLDWDQVRHTHVGADVINEIDVLSLTGHVLTFISCKSGKLGSGQALYALYELQTVAERFGGCYARKKLVTMHPMNDIYLERAEEMGIEVECLHR